MFSNIKEKIAEMKELKAIENAAYEEELEEQKKVMAEVNKTKAIEKGKEKARKRSLPLNERVASFGEKMQEAQDKGLFDIK